MPHMEALRRTWQRHYERTEAVPASAEVPAARQVRFKENRELPPAAAGIESPYDVEARYRQKRDTTWTGYMVHVSETCEPTAPHLLTHVHTTPATVHEAPCTEPMQQARDKCLRFLPIQTCRTDNNAGSFRLNLKILMEVLQWCSLRNRFA